MRKTISKFLALGFITFSLVSCISIPQIPKPFKGTIISCHGIWTNEDSLSFIRRALEHYGDKTHVINHTKINTHASLDTQSKKLFKALLEDHKIPHNEPIALIGHSQGGLRAYLTAKLLKEAGYNVVGVATIGTPWEGTPLLNDGPMRQIDTILGSNGSTTKYLSNKYIREIAAEGIPPHARSILLKGVSNTANIRRIGQESPDDDESTTTPFGLFEMKPGHEGGEKLFRNKLKDNDIPILAIGGFIDDTIRTQIKDLIPMTDFEYDSRNVGTIDKFMDEALGTDKHDFLVPLDSQLAATTDKKNFETYLIPATHFPIDFDSRKISSELTSDKIARRILAFLSKKTTKKKK